MEPATLALAPAPRAIELPPVAFAALPKAISFAVAGVPLTPATAFKPCAIESLPKALAAGPTAIASVPVGELSARTELVWKYLMPAPLLMLLIKLFVANSCEPFTASVLVAFKAAGARLVIVTGAPAPAPPVAPRVILLPPTASYLTAILAVLSMLVFNAVRAPATVVCAVGPVTAPVALTVLIGWLKPLIVPVAGL
nr:hypothetical protein [Collimonas humicola]